MGRSVDHIVWGMVLPKSLCLHRLSTMLYTHDIPKTNANRYRYADDITLAALGSSFERVENLLTNYIETSRLKLSIGKTVISAFHLRNRDAKCKLAISAHGELIKFEASPTYLRVCLDRSFTFKLTWLSSARESTLEMLSCSMLALLAGRCEIVCISPCFTHICASPCLCSCWILLSYLRKKYTHISSGRCAQRVYANCIRLHKSSRNILPTSAIWYGTAWHPLPRPLVPHCTKIRWLTSSFTWLYSQEANAYASQVLLSTGQCNTTSDRFRFSNWWSLQLVFGPNDLDTDQSRWVNLIDEPTVRPPGWYLPWSPWVCLNWLLSGSGRFTTPTPVWCRAIQTAGHIIYQCTLSNPPNGLQSLRNIDQQTVEYLAHQNW